MPNHDYAATIICAEGLRFSDIVAKAVQESSNVKDSHDRAARNKQNTTPLAMAVVAARKAQREAVSALNKHRKEHGC